MDIKDMVYQGRIKVPYKWSVGEYGSRFFGEIKDNKKIFGTRCRNCNKTYIPPRKTCPDCFLPIKDWVEVGPYGTLITFTIVRYSAPLHPLPAPFAVGVILLDGADTGIVHIIGGTDPEKIHSNMRLRPVFREKREGNYLDISYFEPFNP